ncbi:hypothetical protein B0A49_06951 [Cryomyces minteri]|uniref:Uncharacterized protein n=1 Tax=Cryomyces minteri TaxID=331657 RepID=A0A4U0XJ35_9PEZI|nr:hypothetical protein B0A49_06951 [Cryomyces minteri]
MGGQLLINAIKSVYPGPWEIIFRANLAKSHVGDRGNLLVAPSQQEGYFRILAAGVEGWMTVLAVSGRMTIPADLGTLNNMIAAATASASTPMPTPTPIPTPEDGPGFGTGVEVSVTTLDEVGLDEMALDEMVEFGFVRV